MTAGSITDSVDRPSRENVGAALRYCEALRVMLAEDPSKNKDDPSALILLNAITEALKNSDRSPLVTNITIGNISDVSPASSSDDEESVAPSKSFNSFDKTQNDVVATEPGVSYKSETEIAMGRIFSIGAASAVVDPSIPKYAPYSGPSIISMTSFGELGRWGNQILQYMFLRAYAIKHNVNKIQVPSWVGANLFNLSDDPVYRALPPAIEFRGTKANSTFTQDLLDYVEGQHVPNQVPHISPSVFSPSTPSGAAPVNVDIWGWFQWHTRYLAPFRQSLEKILTPNNEIKSTLSQAFSNFIRFKGGLKRTVVGLHLRLGDYQKISASSFGYVAPTSWYLSWLEDIWPKLENPILFVASDDIDTVLRDFKAYSPITADSAGIFLPASASSMNADFFPDWYCLTQCDILAISNSTFSFSAALLNNRPGTRFFRAHYSGNLQEFMPWNAEPVVHRELSGNTVANAIDTLRVVFRTQGTKGLAKNIFYEMPCYGVRALIMKAVLWQKAIM